MTFVLPSKREAGSLSNPDLMQEWDPTNRAINSEGEFVSFNLPPPKPVMPDWSQIKSIRHYFNRVGNFRPFPAWIYHPTEQPRIVKDAHEAAEFGVCYRAAEPDEKSRYGMDHVWDWQEDSKWRPTPYHGSMKFDPNRAEQGKIFVATQQPASAANRELLNTVLPEVTAAVVAALKSQGNVNPSNIDPKAWDEFLAFQAWKKTQEAVNIITGDEPQEPQNALAEIPASLSEAEEMQIWKEEAQRKGIKIDGRWSLERLKTEVSKAA